MLDNFASVLVIWTSAWKYCVGIGRANDVVEAMSRVIYQALALQVRCQSATVEP